MWKGNQSSGLFITKSLINLVWTYDEGAYLIYLITLKVGDWKKECDENANSFCHKKRSNPEDLIKGRICDVI